MTVYDFNHGYTPEELPEFPERTERQILEDVAALLGDIRTLLEHMNSTDRTGAVSSVQIEDWPTKDRPVRVTSKQYTGSPLPVDEALAEHGRLHRGASARAMADWEETLDAVQRNGGL